MQLSNIDRPNFLTNLVGNLPIFANLSQNALDGIAKYSHIKEYKKGRPLFFEGEKAGELHTILEGWVKVFNSNVDGEESVIQISDRNKSLAEVEVLFSRNFSVSAKVIEDSKILSVPAEIIRDEVQKNRHLADNILMNIAHQSQELIRHITQLTLRTAEQRVCCFLLDFLADHYRGDNNISLPYDKSIVASYLAITPETLSRTLKSLGECGYIENKNGNIHILDRQSFCEHCDYEDIPECKIMIK